MKSLKNKFANMLAKYISGNTEEFIPREKINVFDIGRLKEIISQSSQKIPIDEIIFEYYLDDFIKNDAYGKAYSIDSVKRQEILERIFINTRQIPTATEAIVHLILIREILQISPKIKGDIIECGVYKGSSSSSLSIACKLTGRKLFVCDSFEGLPSGEKELQRVYPHLKVYGYYKKGMYAGSLEEVKKNISQYGEIQSCEFVKGYFSDSLKQLHSSFALAFLDVDLTSSLQDCVKYIWPLLVENGFLYTDDSCDMAVVKLWFDDEWWKKEFGIKSPGYIGSGCGLPLNTKFSSLGYTQKVSNILKAYHKAPWLISL